jgi:hypothetical protein
VSSGDAAVPEAARVVATCDTRPERAAALGGPLDAAAYSDYDALLSDPRVEAVDLCVPHPLHAPLALRASTMPGSEGLEDLKMVMAAYRSLASGRLEAVDEEAPEMRPAHE